MLFDVAKLHKDNMRPDVAYTMMMTVIQPRLLGVWGFG